MSLVSRTFQSRRHITHYWDVGPADGPLMIFVHGWPEIGLVWRAQVAAFSARGWRCIAPDMRGYGASSKPAAPASYALRETVTDMVELHDSLGARPAVWVGHDWGTPVIGALAAHHPGRCRGLALIALPYFPEAFALPTLLPLVDRKLYPIDQYPHGQWDYFRFYQTHFEQAADDFQADVAATLAAIFRPASPSAVGTVSPNATVTARGGRYGQAHRAPPTDPDPSLWPPEDFGELVAFFRAHGFRTANAWYLNDEANVAYARATADNGRLRQPVLFLNGDLDPNCDITRSRLGDPMRASCENLTVVNLQGGHWLPLERKQDVNAAIGAWLHASSLERGQP